MKKQEIIEVLKADKKSLKHFYDDVTRLRRNSIGTDIYLRGLIELSNICNKDCYYCGIRKSNKFVDRYYIDKDEVVELAKEVYKLKWGSLVIQSGEICSEIFVNDIAYILNKIKKETSSDFKITLSCGEQTEDTYKLWQDSGADRYLLRFETSSKELYYKYHPKNKEHDFYKRLKAIELLRKTGYQVGTGIMIGTPFQTEEQLAEDLLFIKKLDVDMVGMGPYIEHVDTPMYKDYKNIIPSIDKRVDLALKSLFILRKLMPTINTASTTALESLDKETFVYALDTVANVFMPNITPNIYKRNYKLYQNKISVDLDWVKEIPNLYSKIAFGKNGDSIHYKNRQKTGVQRREII